MLENLDSDAAHSARADRVLAFALAAPVRVRGGACTQ